MNPSLKDQIRGALSRRQRTIVTDARLTKAGVLMPMYEDRNDLCVLFTRRSEEVTQHKGQIAFPGGCQHPDDPSLCATALREAEEEIGLKSSDVEVLGELDDTATATTHFIVTPFVGFIPHPYAFRVNPDEIVELIPLPVRILRDPAVFREEQWDRDGASIPMYFYMVGSHVIWGLTARILRQFLEAAFPDGAARR